MHRRRLLLDRQARSPTPTSSFLRGQATEEKRRRGWASSHFLKSKFRRWNHSSENSRITEIKPNWKEKLQRGKIVSVSINGSRAELPRNRRFLERTKQTEHDARCPALQTEATIFSSYVICSKFPEDGNQKIRFLHLSSNQSSETVISQICLVDLPNSSA